MKIKIGVMGSAGGSFSSDTGQLVKEKSETLGRAIAARDVVLLTGATTGVVYAVGKAAQTAGAFHLGISPASNEQEHVGHYELPTDACDVLIYTGFGLKGRNVVLVRSCDVVLANFLGAGSKASIGSIGEIYWAEEFGKPVFIVRERFGNVHDHAMLNAIASRVVYALEDGFKLIEELAAVTEADAQSA